ncbi:hypothetical protein [Scytonema sp. NUACC26]|uniref:hypothetical protein n=1 Tax=Scytonema sp. NUACC26 TaxID=3140176 RepID=UPI0034DC5A6F
MDFLNAQEKVQLQRILAKISGLQTASERSDFLTICSLRNYCSSISFDCSTDKFVSSLIVQLSKFKIISGNSKKLGLVVLLEYINELGEYEIGLSPEDRDFIQYVINKWEQSKKQSPVPKNSQQPPQSTSSQPPIQRQVNIQPPVSNRPKSVQTTTNNRPNSPARRRQNSAQPSVDTVRYTVIIVKKIWFILVFIVIIWSVVGYFSQSLIDVPSNQMLSVLIIYGFLGGICSGLLGGWLALKLVAPSIQLETSLIYSAIKMIAVAIGWTMVGKLAYNSNMLREQGPLIGFMFGILIAIVIIGWLNLIRHRA